MERGPRDVQVDAAIMWACLNVKYAKKTKPMWLHSINEWNILAMIAQILVLDCLPSSDGRFPAVGDPPM